MNNHGTCSGNGRGDENEDFPINEMAGVPRSSCPETVVWCRTATAFFRENSRSLPARVLAYIREITPMANPINLGGTFPTQAFHSTTGAVITLPDDIQTSYAVVLFYRGHW